MRKIKLTGIIASVILLGLTSCSDDDDNVLPTLEVPTSYVSTNFDANVVTENTVINELATITTAVNEAEANAQNTTVAAITYPGNLASITLDSYEILITDWLLQLVAAANSPDGFQIPAVGETPAEGQEGGLLGTRLLDEYGLELEQMIEKGSFGAALYNHALTVVNAIKDGSDGFTDSGAVDRLVEVFGASPAFDGTATAAAQYAERRSNHTTETGYFYDIETNLITAKAAMDAGSAFNTNRDAALNAFLLNWEESNFATVIFYCNAAKTLLEEAYVLEEGETNTNGETREQILGNAMHAYAEGVAFAHGFKGLSNKQITDAQIDSILTNLLVPEGENPTSYLFLNEESAPLDNLTTVISNIQTIYGFTDEEVANFYINNNL